MSEIWLTQQWWISKICEVQRLLGVRMLIICMVSVERSPRCVGEGKNMSGRGKDLMLSCNVTKELKLQVIWVQLAATEETGEVQVSLAHDASLTHAATMSICPCHIVIDAPVHRAGDRRNTSKLKSTFLQSTIMCYLQIYHALRLDLRVSSDMLNTISTVYFCFRWYKSFASWQENSS